MKCLAILVFVCLLLTVAAFAQQNCAYTYTKAPSFSFCLTPYGTIGMIQSPVGNNLLDANNPIEGFAIDDADQGQGGYNVAEFPSITVPPNSALGLPYAIGPIWTDKTFPFYAMWRTYDSTIQEMVTADMINRIITIKFTIQSVDVIWNEGVLSVALVPVLDGTAISNFGSSQYAGFASWKHGLVIEDTTPSTKTYIRPCAGNDPGGVTQFPYGDGEPCTGSFYNGTGAIYAGTTYGPAKTSVLTFTLTAF